MENPVSFSPGNPWVRIDNSHVSQFVAERRVNLTCHIGGSPPPSVKWLINGKELRDGDLNRTITIRDNRVHGKFGRNTHELLIYNIQLKHAGNYTCEARNKYYTRRRNILVTCSCKLCILIRFRPL